MGGSAGGLLMGAVTNMRPDLFKVVINYVPFVDVINTMLDASLPLTVAEFEEWGNPKIEEQYRYMRSYSPYDNVEEKAYPTMLVKTSYNDSQVMYWEPATRTSRARRGRGAAGQRGAFSTIQRPDPDTSKPSFSSDPRRTTGRPDASTTR